jgi:putative ABC transport system permease protein
VAIIIACLGLYGLTLHTVNIRLKEIVIRKILGAEHRQLVTLLAQKFFLLILISFTIASPVAYYFMKQWLQNFAYHTDISLVSFAMAIVAMTVIAMATVGGQVWKAVLTRPTEGLRSE